jgi:hypothetical protein
MMRAVRVAPQRAVAAQCNDDVLYTALQQLPRSTGGTLYVANGYSCQNFCFGFIGRDAIQVSQNLVGYMHSWSWVENAARSVPRGAIDRCNDSVYRNFELQEEYARARNSTFVLPDDISR